MAFVTLDNPFLFDDQISLQDYVLNTQPEEIIASACSEFNPIARFCLFSGGGDSSVLAHRCIDLYDELMFIDTGTALPGVREHVQKVADFIGKPLRVYEAGDAYKLMVVGGGVRPSDGKPHVAVGFPGPGQHGRAYQRLKERQINSLVRDAKVGYKRRDKVLLLTGVRRAESKRRRNRSPVTRNGGSVFCNPLIDWSGKQMRDYRAKFDFPVSDVTALLHRSGECQCLAFASSGESDMIKSLWPEWYSEVIEPLEKEARRLGIKHHKWGWAGDLKAKDRPAPAEGGELCTSCDFKQEQELLKTNPFVVA